MIAGKKIIVIMPAYNVEKTIKKTYEEIPKDFVDGIIVVDDGSSDSTPAITKSLQADVITHDKNMGYGAAQKSSYLAALQKGADIVVMMHPDYQYPPAKMKDLIMPLVEDRYDVMLGSRIVGGLALKNGMPKYKYIANRFLTFINNLIFGLRLSEYHTGYRAFNRQALCVLPFEANSNDFVFDSEILAQAVFFGLRIGEISTPSTYHKEASSIKFRGGIIYGLGVLRTALKYALKKCRLADFPIFKLKSKDYKQA